jgi:drug/metabolite transporter (DMT)-like permease
MGESLGQYVGELAALMSAFVWAIATVVYRDVGEYLPPVLLNLIKDVVALALFGCTLILVGAPLASGEPIALGLLLLSGAIGIGLGDSVYFECLQCVGARRTLLLGTLAPPLAAFLALVVLGETLTPAGWIGILVTVLGVAWVITERAPNPSEKPAPAKAWGPARLARGIAFGLVAALCQAAGAVLSHSALAHTSISPLWGAFVRLLAGLLALLIWIALTRQPIGLWLHSGQRKADHLWSRLLFAIFTGTFLGIWLQQVAFKHTSAGVAQTLVATSPLFILPLAAKSGENVSARAVLGAIIALIGIGILFGLG